MKILIIVLLLITNVCLAEIPGLTVKNLYIETEKAVRANNSYYLPQGENPKYNANLGLNLKFGKYVYNDYKVVSIVDESQFRHVGLHGELGVKSKWGVDLYFRHFSGHALDSNYDRRFPQDNAIGLRFNLIGTSDDLR